MGRYVPPELEGTVSGNALHRKHPLGARASKPGALTVRFEMPFAVWCDGCPQPTLIGQGVRFNAEKRRVGAYHSTPVLAFRMRHAACGSVLEIRTDPQNTAYVVTEGGRRRAEPEPEAGPGEGGLAIVTDAERDALRASAFARLERTIEDRERLVAASERIGDLRAANESTWEDPYALNRRLRREFRAERHQREADERAGEDLRDRMSLGIELVPASQEDARRAALVDFGPAGAEEDDGGEKASRAALAKPLFKQEKKMSLSAATLGQKALGPDGKPRKKLKSEIAASQMRESLVSEIVSNTRATKDPFLVYDTNPAPTKALTRMPGLKRKRVDAGEGQETGGSTKDGQEIKDDTAPTTGISQPRSMGKTATASTALVTYDSESD